MVQASPGESCTQAAEWGGRGGRGRGLQVATLGGVLLPGCHWDRQGALETLIPESQSQIF